MKISEMTMRTGKLNSRMSDQVVDSNQKLWYASPIIGQIEQYDLRKTDTMYSLWDKDSYVASAKLELPDAKGISETGLFHVAQEYRGQKILSKLLWNFKTRQGRSILKIDSYHSNDVYEIVKGAGLSRFKKYWMNSDGTIEPYDPKTVDNYYAYMGPTGWQLMLENHHKFSDMPHYTTGANWITEDYSWQIK
jgi:hypothetical protein